MQLVYIWCEYDFGGNIASNSGVYSSVEIAEEKVNTSQHNLGEEYITFDMLREEGLANWEYIEVE